VSNGSIPRDPSWCSYCVTSGRRCGDHASGDYGGRDVYEPSSWVLSVVGERFRSWDGVYRCFGYDPRNGFWMQAVSGERMGRKTNVSERAIGATFHHVTMGSGSGAARLLSAWVRLGRPLTDAEMANELIHAEYATAKLRDLGYLDASGVTAEGRAAAMLDNNREMR